MKLLALLPQEGLSLPGLRASALQTLVIGEGAYKDWQVHVRGPSVFLVSQPGWQGTNKPLEGDERRVYEIPRDKVYLSWSFGPADSLDGVVKWSPTVRAAPLQSAAVESAPQEPPPGTARHEQTPPTAAGQSTLDEDELERLTRPKGKR